MLHYSRMLGNLLRESGSGFLRHHIPRRGAALAFYALLSLSPLLVIVLAVLSPIFGSEAARGELAIQIENLAGEPAAKTIESLLSNAHSQPQGWLATAFGVGVILYGASSVFVELKDALDDIWETPAVSRKGWGLRELAFERVLAFITICGLTFLLLASLIFSALLAAVGDHLSRYTALEPLFSWSANVALSFTLTALLFAMIFKLLPSFRPPWSQVWFGALVTALLFTLGKALLGIYLGRAAIGSAYGAAGSLVVILVWVYYSTQILLFGAEMTRALGITQGNGLRQAPQ